MSELAPAEGLRRTQDQFENVAQRSLWMDALERLAHNRAALVGAFIACLVLFVAAFGPFLAPKNFTKTNLERRLETPSHDYWLGTDILGRDVFSRVLHGARTAVLVALVTILVSTIIGVMFGAIAAYVGGWVDDLIMRVVDTLYGLPDLLIAALLAVSLRGPVAAWLGQLQTRTGWGFLDNAIILDYLLLFGALAMVNWSGYARLIRGQILSLRELDFIRAEVALGLTTWQIIRKHLIPNSIAPVVVSVTMSIGGIMLSEASLSFLGLGVQPPGASWGTMISENLQRVFAYPHLVIMPGIVLSITVFGFNFLGDGINDALDPRSQRRRGRGADVTGSSRSRAPRTRPILGLRFSFRTRPQKPLGG